MSANADEPAFPTVEIRHQVTGELLQWPMPGLNKREWFAGMALQGLLANHARVKEALNDACAPDNTLGDEWDQFARWAVWAADAILDELAKSPEGGTP